MKTERMVIIIQATNKKAYQVLLTNREADFITNVVSQLHGGTVKCMKEELPLDFKTILKK